MTSMFEIGSKSNKSGMAQAKNFGRMAVLKRLLLFITYWAFRRHQVYFTLRWSNGNLKLHIGCGNIELKGYINIDIRHAPAADFVTDARKLPCKSNSVEIIETYHVIEHISFSDVESMLHEWYRVLMPKGRLVIECPDFDKAIAEYLSGNEKRLYSIYGRRRYNGDSHLWGYNAKRLKRLLISVGFSKTNELEAKDRHKNEEPCLRIEATK